MPEKTYISSEKETMPWFKAPKDWLTMMLEKNTDESFKLKPLLVYLAANTWTLKNTLDTKEDYLVDKPIPMKKSDTKLLEDGFTLIDQTLALFKQQDPNVECYRKVADKINDAIKCYHIIYDEKKKKTIQSSQLSTSNNIEPQPSTFPIIEKQEEVDKPPQQISKENDDPDESLCIL